MHSEPSAKGIGPAATPTEPMALRALDRAVEWLLALILTALLGIGAAQILARFAFSLSLAWALEASVLLMVWATMLSGYVGIRRDRHLSADFIGLAMSAQIRWWLQLTGLALCLAFVLVYGTASLTIVDAMGGIPFTALPFTQPALYWSLPVSAALMAVALVVRIVRHVRHAASTPAPA